MRRIAAYALMAFAACAFYLCWSTIELSISSPGSWRISLAVSLLFCLSFAASLLPLSLIWIGVVWAYSKVRISGGVYFTSVGATLTVLLGCAASSLAPKPFFIEDQTFFEGFLIALERQGLCLIFAGALLGLGYWLIAEKKRSTSGKTPNQSTQATCQ